MQYRPHFKEYVMARLVTVAVVIFLCFEVLLFLSIEDTNVVLWSSVCVAFSFIFFIFSIYRGASRMQKELTTINRYLSNLDKVEKIDYKARFFTQEFEEINQNLIKVLKKSKKREDTKQRYNAKLKLKNRQRADMLSAIAHEFRNPISSITGYAQTLQEDPSIPKPLQEKFLGKIYNNGEKIEALLSRLILWNKFESKETTLHKSKFDILILTKEVKSILEESYKERTIEIIGESRVVEADRTLIEVVLQNLIENALKYSKENVIVQLTDERISVRDKGIGIEREELDRVTKKFYRSSKHSWDNSMGLGLSIVKTILSLHQSKLEIQSHINKGSNFSFKLF